MCGISGVISDQVRPKVEHDFLVLFDGVKHRGPNGNKTFEGSFPNSQGKNYIFGHHRLAIIDLSSRADQPLVSDRGSVLIINGEIYNYKELRSSLRNDFYFKSLSDSEVVLAVLELYGISGIEKLEGMFAFAFYPAGGRSVWLGRDRLGVKPLYFSKENEDVWFSSEARPLAKALSRPLDEIGVSEWVKYQFQLSDRTFFKDIYSVPPAHILVIEDGRISSHKYWDLEDHLANNSVNKITESTAIYELRDLLESAIRSHLIADVDVATITSGGLDSSAISALAAQGGVKQAFMGRYLDKGFDESDYAKLVAQKAGLNLNIIDISSEDYFQALPMVASALDFPVAGPGSVGHYIVSKVIAKSHKIVLSGTGGDELFLGYTRDRFAIWATQKIAGVNPFVSQEIPQNIEGYESLFLKFKDAGGLSLPMMGFMATIERSAKENRILSINPEISELHNLKLLELINPERGISQLNMHDSLVRYEMLRFLPSLLQVEDRMSMSHGLEARVPFLDKNLVEFMIKLPSNLKLSENNSKEILRKSLSGVVPDRVIQRTDKLGFPVPLLKWIKSDKIEEITLLIDSLNKHSIPGVNINTQNISKIISKSDTRELWGAMILASWLNSFE